MARIRSVHPGLWTDEAFVSVSLAARLLHIGIWNECDDIGCFEWKPLGLRMRLFPADNADVPALLAELEGADMVRRYTVNGRDFGAVRNFRRFQRPKAPKSVHPNTPDILLYVGSSEEDGEKGGDQGGGSPEAKKDERSKFPKKSETPPPEAPPVPPNSEIAPQMEDGGDKMEERKETSPLPSVAPPSAEKPPKADPRGSRLAAGWRPDDDGAAYAIGLKLDVAAVAENFRDYWHAKAGADGRKLDWAATWRTWCRRDAEQRPQQRSGNSGQLRPKPHHAEVMDAWMAELAPHTPPEAAPFLDLAPGEYHA